MYYNSLKYNYLNMIYKTTLKLLLNLISIKLYKLLWKIHFKSEDTSTEVVSEG